MLYLGVEEPELTVLRKDNLIIAMKQRKRKEIAPDLSRAHLWFGKSRSRHVEIADWKSDYEGTSGGAAHHRHMPWGSENYHLHYVFSHSAKEKAGYEITKDLPPFSPGTSVNDTVWNVLWSALNTASPLNAAKKKKRQNLPMGCTVSPRSQEHVSTVRASETKLKKNQTHVSQQQHINTENATSTLQLCV